MEIQALRLVVTDQDLNHLAEQALTQNPQVKDLRVAIAPDGVHVSGVYVMMMGISFETVWTPSVKDGKVAAQLANLKVSGFGGAMLKPALMAALSDTLKQEEGIAIQGDAIVVDPDRLLAAKGVQLRLNLSHVSCAAGQIVIESAIPA